jgi:phage-related protein
VQPLSLYRTYLPIYAQFSIIERMKAIIWMGSSKVDLKAFPAAVMDDMGHQLFRVQCGLEPDDWKPMTTIGIGVKEIRVKDTAGIFRTVYLATRPEAVYVLHCFQKKTQATARRDIGLARLRLKGVLR